MLQCLTSHQRRCNPFSCHISLSSHFSPACPLLSSLILFCTAAGFHFASPPSVHVYYSFIFQWFFLLSASPPFLLTPQNVFLFFIHTSVLCLVFPCLVWSMLSIYDTFFFLSFFSPPSSPPANGKDLCWLCWSPSAEEFNEFDGLFAGSVLEVDNGF